MDWPLPPKYPDWPLRINDDYWNASHKPLSTAIKNLGFVLLPDDAWWDNQCYADSTLILTNRHGRIIINDGRRMSRKKLDREIARASTSVEESSLEDIDDFEGRRTYIRGIRTGRRVIHTSDKSTHVHATLARMGIEPVVIDPFEAKPVRVIRTNTHTFGIPDDADFSSERFSRELAKIKAEEP